MLQGAILEAPEVFFGGVSGVSPKSENCPVARSRWSEAAADSEGSTSAKRAARFLSTQSNAPHFTRLSRNFLFTARESRREQNSSSVRKGPLFSLSAMADSIAPAPTFLMDANPKRMPGPSVSGANLSTLALISGGSTGISMRRHSAMTTARRSVSFASKVSMADMNSRGKWALR